jgi:hypothetical protein
MSKYKMRLSTTRGGSLFSEEITVTPVGDYLVGRMPNAFSTSENLYGVYTKEGKLVKGGFDKHAEALSYANKLISGTSITREKTRSRY